MVYTVGFLIGVAIFFIPSIIAGFRNHKHPVAVLVLNALSGFIPFGWIATLIWALIG
jgi:hypothetical protein